MKIAKKSDWYFLGGLVVLFFLVPTVIALYKGHQATQTKERRCAEVGPLTDEDKVRLAIEYVEHGDSVVINAHPYPKAPLYKDIDHVLRENPGCCKVIGKGDVEGTVIVSLSYSRKYLDNGEIKAIQSDGPGTGQGVYFVNKCGYVDVD